MKIWNKKNGVILLAVVLLITAFARCSAGKAGLPKAKGFEKQFSKMVEKVLDIDNVELLDYKEDGNMISFNLAGVSYTATIRDGKVFSIYAFVGYELYSFASEDGELLLTTLLAIPAAVFDNTYRTPKRLAALLMIVESNRVEEEANSIRCEYIEENLEYSYTVTTYDFFQGFGFQARYIGD